LRGRKRREERRERSPLPSPPPAATPPPPRPGSFDGAISISAVQWLCNADRSSHDPRRRIRAFFGSLYAALRRGARAVLQIYPENAAQARPGEGFEF